MTDDMIDVVQQLGKARERIYDLEWAAKINDVETKQIIADLERLLAEANARIAELERQLACSRVVATWDCAKWIETHKFSLSGKVFDAQNEGPDFLQELQAKALRALATAPSGYVCVQVGIVEFAKAVVTEARESMSDLDGGYLQDLMVENGILRPFTATESCGKGNCECGGCGFPTECFRYTKEFLSLLAERDEKNEHRRHPQLEQ